MLFGSALVCSFLMFGSFGDQAGMSGGSSFSNQRKF